jgi:4-amino-4-deoxy-L-arabinose transferase-like glycosyltransferase
MARVSASFVCLLIAILAFTGFTLYKQSPIDYVGLADDAQYAEMSRNFLAGEGLTVDFVQYFFLKYPAVHRPDDISSPLYPVLGALSFALFGISALAAKLVSIAFGLVGIPLLAYWFGRKHFGSAAGLFGGLVALFNPLEYTSIIQNYNDALFGFLLLLAIIVLYESFENERWLYALGFVLGVMVFAKPTTILLAPFFAIIVLLWQRRISAPAVGGALIAAVIAAAYFGMNWMTLGSPLLNISKYVVFAHGNDQGFKVFWDTAPPSFSWFLAKYGVTGWLSRVAGQIVKTLLYLLPIHVALVWGLLSSRRKRVFPLAFLFLAMCAINTLYWVFEFRYYMAFFAGAAVVGFALLFDTKWRNAFGVLSFALVLSLALFTASKYYAAVDWNHASLKPAEYPFKLSTWTQERLDLGAWMNANLPANAVVMSTRPRDLSFYSRRLAVMIPDENPETILRVARYYNVTFIERGGLTDKPRSIDAELNDTALFFPLAQVGQSTVYTLS